MQINAEGYKEFIFNLRYHAQGSVLHFYSVDISAEPFKGCHS